METFLDMVHLNVWAQVRNIGAQEALARRLRDFGFVPGTRVCCRYRDPTGHVTALEVRGAVIALRTSDLHTIEVIV